MTTTWCDAGVVVVEKMASPTLLKRMKEWSCEITRIESNADNQMTLHFTKPRLSGKANTEFLEDIHVIDEVLNVEVVG